jgi:aspartyl-tRNA(Asn)/glutamyl-tRNA(Gln) amidotransferase subunit A
MPAIASRSRVPPTNSMSDNEVVWSSALDLVTRIRQKDVSPVEVTEAILGRIEALNPRLNAFCLLAADQARAAARDAEVAVMKREPLGPLHGVPVSIKDVIFTRGLRTTGGSRLLVDLVPEHDAVAVARLRAAGAIVLGKTTTSEFGHKAVTTSPLFGVTRNPWDLTRTPGGSSGGAAAAVASGLGPIGLGTDGGGSVRLPAAFCGVVGFKPSYGRIPEYPSFPGWDHVSHTGPITRTVRDAALVLDAIAGGDDRDPGSLPMAAGSFLEACDRDIRGLHVAWSSDLGYARVDPVVQALCENAAAEFETLGCHVEVVNPAWESLEESFGTMLAAQFHAAFGEQIAEHESEVDPTLAKFVARGAGVSTREYLLARARMREFWQEVLQFLARFDLLITPTVAVPPFGAEGKPPREIGGEPASVLGWMPFTYPFNITGQPAASVPAGWTAENLPIGVQIVGQRHADATLLAACAAYEAACPWSARRPAP